MSQIENVITLPNLGTFLLESYNEFARVQHVHRNVTRQSDGFMSAQDKSTLDALYAWQGSLEDFNTKEF